MKTFPVMTEYRHRRNLGADHVPRSLPWAMVAPFERRAKLNHGGQDLDTLARRGGLSPYELRCLLSDRSLFPLTNDYEADVAWLNEHVANWVPPEPTVSQVLEDSALNSLLPLDLRIDALRRGAAVDAFVAEYGHLSNNCTWAR